ncbi:zinc finger, DHHC-type containing 18 [Gorgonomyces haynaldii]|nr:zinc finger, DHHC-type containing 18 [Gorgonomyces haynaldii]
MEQEVVILNGHRLPLKFCQTCNIYRPPRASHCAECDCCIDRMDHHCPWVANCVGKRNHKFFLAFLWSCALLATQVLVISILELMQRIDEMLYPCIVSIGTVFSLYGMALYHSFLVFTNQTTRQQVIVLMVDQKASQYLRQRTNRELFRVLQ